MAEFPDIVDDRGRIGYNALVTFVQTYSEAVFVSLVQHPLLVGKELYEGDLRKMAFSRTGGTVETQTMLFQPQEIRKIREGVGIKEDDFDRTTMMKRPGQTQEGIPQQPQPQGIARAIFALRKGPNSLDRTSNVITIGRSFANDVTVADFVVSKHHAQITIFYGRYFIADLDSTNGTKVNQRQLQPNVKVKLSDYAEVAFGRMAFIFIPPGDFYRQFRQRL
jgi:hypothetical protein